MTKMLELSEFCEYLSSRKPSALHIKEALTKLSMPYHVAQIDVFISEKKGFIPDASSKYLTLIKDPDNVELGERIEYRYTVEVEGETAVVIYIQKGYTPTEEDRRFIKLSADVTFFYFGRLRLDNLVEKSAVTHFMTGLPNAGGYLAKIQSIIDKNELPNYTAFYINLRGFGLYSKHYGIREADDMMKQYAKQISDFVDTNGIVGHLGGDNFVAIITKPSVPSFFDFLKDVTVNVKKENELVPVSVTATVGAWNIDNNDYDPADVISLPSIAHNIAKNVEHKSLCYVTDKLLHQVSEQKNILKLFPDAIKSGEFIVFYQPKVDSRTNTMVGGEALVRWMRNGEILPPNSFIPVLEREGLVKELDLYVLDHACRYLRKWIDDGIAPIPISVNISRSDLNDPKLATKIATIIDKYHLDPRFIEIEVTETTNETEHGYMTSFLNQLWSMKISTAIDDFGSGYSSLSTLRNFQIRTLKIDRSFINNDLFLKSDEVILRGIIEMADKLGIDVITEGVEREDQLQFINSVGCHIIQGFFYDKPMPAGAFEIRLRNKTYEVK